MEKIIIVQITHKINLNFILKIIKLSFKIAYYIIIYLLIQITKIMRSDIE